MNDYGPLGNAELLRRYGFVEADPNPHDCCQLPVSALVDAAVATKGEHEGEREGLHYLGEASSIRCRCSILGRQFCGNCAILKCISCCACLLISTQKGNDCGEAALRPCCRCQPYHPTLRPKSTFVTREVHGGLGSIVGSVARAASWYQWLAQHRGISGSQESQQTFI